MERKPTDTTASPRSRATPGTSASTARPPTSSRTTRTTRPTSSCARYSGSERAEREGSCASGAGPESERSAPVSSGLPREDARKVSSTSASNLEVPDRVGQDLEREAAFHAARAGGHVLARGTLPEDQVADQGRAHSVDEASLDAWPHRRPVATAGRDGPVPRPARGARA